MDEIDAMATPDASHAAWLLRAGALAALLLAAGYVVMMPLFATVGAPPVGAEARVMYHATGTATWWGITGLSVLTDLLFVPVAVALYVALRGVNGPAIRLATAFTMLFVVLDLAVLWPAKVSMITLGQAYAAASTDEARALVVAAAGYPAAVLDSGLTPVYSILTLGIGVAVTGAAMLRGQFSRSTAIIGIATGSLGIASVAETAVTGSFPVLVVGASLLTIVWLVLVARDLWRGVRAARRLDQPPGDSRRPSYRGVSGAATASVGLTR